MIDPLQITIILVSFTLFVLVIEMVRRERLREDYSLLWLGMFGVVFILSLVPRRLIDRLSAEFFGIAYSPSLFFSIAFVLLIVVLIQFSVVITKLARENKQAAQHIAFLTLRVEQLEQQLSDEG